MSFYYEYECEVCGLLIDHGNEQSTGAVFLYKDEVFAVAHDLGLKSPSEASVENFASIRAPWRVMHYDCDPIEHGEFYWIDVDRLRNPDDVGDFEHHLDEKRYKGLIQSLWELVTHPDRLLRTEGRSVVRQTSPLTLTFAQGVKRVG